LEPGGIFICKRSIIFTHLPNPTPSSCCFINPFCDQLRFDAQCVYMTNFHVPPFRSPNSTVTSLSSSSHALANHYTRSRGSVFNPSYPVF